MNLFSEAVFTWGQGSRGKGQCRCSSCHLHWPGKSKEKIDFNIRQRKITAINIPGTWSEIILCITSITSTAASPLICSLLTLSWLPSQPTGSFEFFFSWAAPTRLRSRRTAASAGWLKRNLCTPPKVITVPGEIQSLRHEFCSFRSFVLMQAEESVSVCAAVYISGVEWMLSVCKC